MQGVMAKRACLKPQCLVYSLVLPLTIFVTMDDLYLPHFVHMRLIFPMLKHCYENYLANNICSINISYDY